MRRWHTYQGKVLMMAAAVAVAAGGCGYTTRSMITSKYRTLYITPFVNKVDITNEAYTQNKYRIYKPLLESDITKAVSSRFLLDGNLRPTRESLADVFLKGDLVQFKRDPLRYTDSDDVEEYRISIVVDISLWYTKTKEQIWQENGFTGSTTYFTSFSSSTPKKTDDAAVQEAIADLARRIVERAVEEW